MVMTSLPVHLLLQRKLLGLGVQSFLFYCRYYLFALFVFFLWGFGDTTDLGLIWTD